MDYYLRKTFYKTASLMANSCKAIAVLAQQPSEVAHAAWTYGNELGLAFQVGSLLLCSITNRVVQGLCLPLLACVVHVIAHCSMRSITYNPPPRLVPINLNPTHQLVDDVLDFTGTTSQLGKPALNDLRSGIATAPVLLAAEEFPQLVPLIHRKFKHAGDVAEAQALVARSSGVTRAKELAAQHARNAMAAMECMPLSDMPHVQAARRALVEVSEKVLTRTK